MTQKVTHTAHKLIRNALLHEQHSKFTREEKHQLVTTLKSETGMTNRELSVHIGVPHSTIHDWLSLRQDNTKGSIHISLSNIFRKLQGLNPCDVRDWGRLEQIAQRCEELLEHKPK